MKETFCYGLGHRENTLVVGYAHRERAFIVESCQNFVLLGLQKNLWAYTKEALLLCAIDTQRKNLLIVGKPTPGGLLSAYRSYRNNDR
jgi:hypothetical protein